MAITKATPLTTDDAQHIITEPLNPHSVALNRGSNGVVTIEVKTYGATTEEAMEETKRIFDKLVKTYPYAKLG